MTKAAVAATIWCRASATVWLPGAQADDNDFEHLDEPVHSCDDIHRANEIRSQELSMKILCDSCGAKYSIADEKVAGKVFKIRCKRCSEVIMVRGDQQAAEAQDAAAGAAGGAPDEIWHVVVNGEQQGPHSPLQLGEMLTNGTVDWDAYVWTEGFDNWIPMRDVEDLVAQITGGAQQQTAAAASAAQTTAAGGYHAATGTQGAVAQGAVAASAAYTAQPSMGADPFADPPAGGNATDDAGPDLFGGVAAASAGGGSFGGGVVSSSPNPGGDEPAMTGTRNENSVLFSLKNLQALATGSNPPSAAPPSAAPGPAGFAGGEGSGLIDIRALASATGIGEQPDKSDGDKDELLAMGGQGAAFGTLGSPMLAPAAEDREGGNKMLLVVASIIGVSVVAAGGLVAYGMLRQPDAPPPQPPSVAPAPAAAPAPTPTPQAPATQAAAEEPQSEGEKAAQAAAATREAHKDRPRSSSSTRRSRQETRREKDTEPAGQPEPQTAAPKPKPKPRGGKASLDELLEGALGGGGSKPTARKQPKADDNLPEKPGRKDVVAAMKKVSGAVSKCSKGAGGVAFANVTVAGSTGRVKSVQVEGQTGAVGSCIARAVRKARFPRFKSNVFKVKYPFRL